ncbi:MAG TPA: hydrogenase maturation protease [Azospira sp.]|nr:hydrogenase maturation protease [Azospira sp.]HNN46359.1 hydrogenase maturation protease [Azospira sp.]
MSVAPFVVLACGNPSRGDDAIGPALLARLATWLDEEGLADAFELIEDFQFQIEHALDLKDRCAALFIDAGERTPAPFALCPVDAHAPPSHSTHAISPAAVLAVYHRVVKAPAPTCDTLCVCGESFELGDGLSPAAAACIEAAWPALQSWCREAVCAGTENEKA